MPTNPHGAVINKGLTDYAVGIFQDYSAIFADADFLAPRVVTGASVGNFAKFDDKLAFLKYDASRAVGGSRTRVKFAGETGSFDCKPKSLEIGIDDTEANRAAGRRDLLEKAKMRTLLSNFAIARVSRVVAKAVTSGVFTAATGDKAGKWSDANVDPVEDVDAQIALIYANTGMFPNRLLLDFGSWLKFRNHPKVRARLSTAKDQSLSLAQAEGLFAVPLTVRLARGSVATTGLGSATATKTSVLPSTALLFYAEDAATQYDPTALKTITPTEQSFEAVMQYRDDTCASDMYYIDVEEDIISASALLLVKLAIV